MKWLLGLVTGGNPLLLAIGAGVLLSIGAAGGWKVASWRAAAQVAAAQHELAELERQTSATIIARLEENQALRERQDRAAGEVAAAYQKGKTDVARSFQPALADLQQLRDLVAGGAGRLPERAQGGAGAVPGAPAGAGGVHGAACTDRPGDLVVAAHRVAEELAACARDLERFKALQAWVRTLRPP